MSLSLSKVLVNNLMVSSGREDQGYVYRAAIIGGGRIGADCGPTGEGSSRIASHAAAYTASSRVQLVAVADSDEDCLRRCSQRWGVTGLYKNSEEMFSREKIDLLSICTPPNSHTQILGQTFNAASVKGILLEKPIARDLEGADAAMEMASRSTAKIGVNYIRRFPPLYRQLAAELQAGDLGQIQHVNILYTKGIINNGSHAFDLLRFLFGEPREVSVFSRCLYEGTDPTLNVRVEFPGRFEAWLCGLDSEAYNVFEVDILGSEGRVAFRDQGHVLERFGVDDVRDKHGFRQLGSPPVVWSTDLSRAVEYAVEDLIYSIETDSPPACTMMDGYAALKLSLQMVESVANHKN